MKANKSTFRELLLDPEKKRAEAENELAYLFRDIMLAHGVTPSEWDRRLDSFYKRLYTNSKGQTDPVKVNQEKSNLVRALTKDALPWNRFNRALQLMGSESYTISVDLNYADGRVHTHKVKVRNRVADQIHSEQQQLEINFDEGDDDE